MTNTSIYFNNGVGMFADTGGHDPDLEQQLGRRKYGRRRRAHRFGPIP